MVARRLRQSQAKGLLAPFSRSADDAETVVADGLSPLEAEILCEMKMADLPKAAAEPVLDEMPEEPAPKQRRGRQLALKF